MGKFAREFEITVRILVIICSKGLSKILPSVLDMTYMSIVDLALAAIKVVSIANNCIVNSEVHAIMSGMIASGLLLDRILQQLFTYTCRTAKGH